MPLVDATRIPDATYRLQLRREFPFAAAEALVPYFESLGVSDCYCSPVFLSTPGSSHGYDVNDYRRIDPELGGPRGLGQLHAALAERGLGLLLDFVPNHMGINGPGLFNAWWRQVLEGGVHSRYAQFFDINWDDPRRPGPVRILVPILDDQYGRVLEAGRLSLVRAGAQLSVQYAEMLFPLRPHSYATVLKPLLDGAGEEAPALSRLIGAFTDLPRPDAAEEADAAKARALRITALRDELDALLRRQPELARRLDARLHDLNGRAGEPRSFDRLDALLEEQHYRLAFWKAGLHETNYRRFFAIDSLIGLRMELREVFDECHAALARLLADGVVTGLRIDHIDGLRDPHRYLDRLQELGRGPGAASSAPRYVVVEKILAPGEGLPPGWPAHGTTGYDFISSLAGLFVEARHAAVFTSLHGAFTGETAAYEDVVYEKKQLVLEEMFANAVARLADTLVDALASDRHWRDLTRHALLVAVRELMAGHRVYRTYRRRGEKMDETDRREVDRACAAAIRRNARMDPQPFTFVRDVLTGDYPPAGAPPGLARDLGEWVLDFQQYTGAVMAKAVEDTAYYTYSRLIALNEVGGDPAAFGGTVAEFHAANLARAQQAPHSLLATATHDTKFGEDVRARLYALSELPQEWREWTELWARLNRRHKSEVGGRWAPDADEEYRLYQVLLGAWPEDDAPPDDAFRRRLREHLRKAVAEAKRNTTWVQPNLPWLEAIDRFVDAILHPETSREFLEHFRTKAGYLARLGVVNSLSQLVLKLTSPGVPDFYQGTEFWDLSLVDPDNRRPVDFAPRQALAAADRPFRPRALLQSWTTGEIKAEVMRRLLRFRRAHAALFRDGGYAALPLAGRFERHAAAFVRAAPAGNERLAVVVPRLTARMGCPPLGLVWDDTVVALPQSETGWSDVLTGREFPGAGELRLADGFTDLPFCVLLARAGDNSGPPEHAKLPADPPAGRRPLP